jgi:hypothetical protein
MIEKRTYIDQIEITANNMVQVRTRNTVIEDGIELTSGLHRHVVAPGKCSDAEDPKVQAICAAVHTPEVIADYQAAQAAAQANIEV